MYTAFHLFTGNISFFIRNGISTTYCKVLNNSDNNSMALDGKNIAS